jgi:hypothetical protein
VPINDASKFLVYADLQMAAEAIDLDKVLTGERTLIQAIEKGNNHSSVFTSAQAVRFTNEWEVVAHQPNTSTGFSGTVFRSRVTDPTRGVVEGQLVMSFRSTEFIDDAARDNQATNVFEVKEFGWAFDQIDDMMTWFDRLNGVGGPFAGGQAFSVTGYSLGSNLATAFNLMMQDRVEFNRITATYSFNGAGAGDVRVPGTTLSDVRQTFHDLRNLAGGVGGLFTDPAVRSLYQQLRTRLNRAGERATAEDMAAAQALLSQLPNTTRIGEVNNLLKAMERKNAILDEIARLPSVHHGSDASKDPLQVAAENVAATQLDYQLAALKAGSMTSSYSIALGVANTIVNRRAIARDLPSEDHGAARGHRHRGPGSGPERRHHHTVRHHP